MGEACAGEKTRSENMQKGCSERGLAGDQDKTIFICLRTV